MNPTDPIFWLIVVSSFVASAISGAFAVGGGFLMLAVVAVFFPIAAVVPMHSVLMLGTSIGRTIFFRKHIYWPIVVPFVFGSMIGAPVGARIYVDLPEVLVAIVVGLFMLAALWVPALTWRPRIRHPFFFVGIGHSFLSALFSFGGLMQPLMMRTTLDKMQVIATLAVSLLAMNVFKLVGYAAFGFDFRPHLQLIAVAILAGVAGARVGMHIVQRMPEEKFRIVFKIIMTAFAFQLFYRAWSLA
ncbi:MAG: sulfite exporter TauE/SafE family protein [Gammaproteobacteria bacterium]|nr:sulfite exporter TauE/SafE family protein [Gammaproteobacteria bacterium]